MGCAFDKKTKELIVFWSHNGTFQGNQNYGYGDVFLYRAETLVEEPTVERIKTQ